MRTNNSTNIKIAKLILILLVSMLVYGNVAAQNTYIRSMMDFFHEIEGPEAPMFTQKAYSNIAGTPYQHPNFIEGTLIRNDGITYEKIPLRYNSYDDRIEFKYKNNAVLYLADPNDYKEFKIGNESYIYHNDIHKSLKGYYQVLEGGKLQLLVKHGVGLKDQNN